MDTQDRKLQSTSRPGRLRLTRRGRAVMTALAAAPVVVGILAGSLAAGSAAAVGRSSAASGQAVAAVREVTVRPGDSLWSVAVRIAPDRDPRLTVRTLVQWNALTTTTLTPGEQLAVPVAGTARQLP